MDGHDEMVVRRALKDAGYNDDYTTRLLHGLNSRDAFIEKAAIAAMQGMIPLYNGVLDPKVASLCAKYAAMLWDAIQARKEGDEMTEHPTSVRECKYKRRNPEHYHTFDLTYPRSYHELMLARMFWCVRCNEYRFDFDGCIPPTMGESLKKAVRSKP